MVTLAEASTADFTQHREGAHRGALRRPGSTPRRRPRGGAQAAQAQLPHAARARRGGADARLRTRLRALPSFSRCAAAGSLPAPVVTLAWTPLIDRAAATLPPAGPPHQPSCRRPRRHAGPRTEIRPGARAHHDTNPNRAHAPPPLPERRSSRARRLTRVPRTDKEPDSVSRLRHVLPTATATRRS